MRIALVGPVVFFVLEVQEIHLHFIIVRHNRAVISPAVYLVRDRHFVSGKHGEFTGLVEDQGVSFHIIEFIVLQMTNVLPAESVPEVVIVGYRKSVDSSFVSGEMAQFVRFAFHFDRCS